MGEVVAFPKKKRKRLRPNRKEGRPPAELSIFPVLRSSADYLDDAALDVAARVIDVSEALRDLYESRFWQVPKVALRKEFSRAGWYVYQRANAIRDYCGLPDLEPPNGPRQSRNDRTPPSAA